VHVFDASAPALPGHYGPATRTLAEIEATATTQDVGHLVLVQPSVYGSDHRVLLRALAAAPGRHRGVAVVDAGVGDAELDTLHRAGVRGVRFNRVSPLGQQGDPAPLLRALAPRLRDRGWHLQWYVPAAELALLPPLQAESGLVFVLDHLAGIAQELPADDPAWPALAQLAAGGAWVKLSGWYRLGSALPYAGLQAHIARVAALFGDRMVWGSDWPHTGQADAPPYAATWAPVAAALPDALAEHVRKVFPTALYR
jgi:predicted TIM-barrel fold metal-dependent hydrolase